MHQVISCTKYTFLLRSTISAQRMPSNGRCTFAFAFVPHQTCDLSPSAASTASEPEGPWAEAIDDVALMDRFDSKYVVPVAWLEDLVHDLGEHSVLSIQNQVATVYNNLYFDTPDGRCLDAHTPRQNVRQCQVCAFRHRHNTTVTFLEVKLRDVHGKTFKHRIVRQGHGMPHSPSRKLGSFANTCPMQRIFALQSSFERFTLIHVGQGERITFDHELQFRCLMGLDLATFLG